MRYATLLALLVSTAPLSGWGGDPDPKQPSAQEVRRRFFRCWLEVERIDAGRRITDPGHLTGIELTQDGYWCWGRVGELAAGPGERGVRLDATARPMRVDFLGGTRGVALPKAPSVNPGIFKFEGDKLVIVLGGWTKASARPPGGDFPNRPRAFRSTKESRSILQVFTPCQKYDQ
jgi:hypothetical protein